MSAASVFRSVLVYPLGLLGLLALTGGCCVYPLQNDRGPNFYRSFAGATLNPGERVEIQGKNFDGTWETFHATDTGEIPIRGWCGIEYYPWVCPEVWVPSRFWSDPHGISVNVSEVRVIDSSGRVMHTYHKAWTTDDLWLNPLDVWGDKGNAEFSLRLFQHWKF